MATDNEKEWSPDQLGDAIASAAKNLFKKETAEERAFRGMAAIVLVGLVRAWGTSTTFTLDSTPPLFIEWFRSKTRKGWRVPTENGNYVMNLDYVPSPEWLEQFSEANLVLAAAHDPPGESYPIGIIAFTLVPLSASRLEITGAFNIPEVSPIFQELLQLIGTAYPESGLATQQSNRGGRPKSGGHTSEQLQRIKRVGELRAQGLSHAQIGEKVNLTRSRVSQICRENGFEKGNHILDTLGP